MPRKRTPRSPTSWHADAVASPCACCASLCGLTPESAPCLGRLMTLRVLRAVTLQRGLPRAKLTWTGSRPALAPLRTQRSRLSAFLAAARY
eukprot:1217749-Rhodomonas_salina.1